MGKIDVIYEDISLKSKGSQVGRGDMVGREKKSFVDEVVRSFVKVQGENRNSVKGEHVAPLYGRPLTSGQMSYDLRRLRLHGLIERIPKTRRYLVTDLGFRAALFLSRTYSRLVRPGLAAVAPEHEPTAPVPLRRAIENVDRVLQQGWEAQQLAA